jgi:hypothetical protein
MGNADWNDTAGARQERDTPPVEVQDRLAFEHVEALLERVDVRRDVTVLEAAEPEAHVDGARRPIDERAALEPVAV